MILLVMILRAQKDLDFDPEAMAKDESAEEPLEDLVSEEVAVEDNFWRTITQMMIILEPLRTAQVAGASDYIEENNFGDADDSEDSLFVDEGGWTAIKYDDIKPGR